MTQNKPGIYNANLNIQATPDRSCDPSVHPCEQWLPGTYQVKIGKLQTTGGIMKTILIKEWRRRPDT